MKNTPIRKLIIGISNVKVAAKTVVKVVVRVAAKVAAKYAYKSVSRNAVCAFAIA